MSFDFLLHFCSLNAGDGSEHLYNDPKIVLKEVQNGQFVQNLSTYCTQCSATNGKKKFIGSIHLGIFQILSPCMTSSPALSHTCCSVSCCSPFFAHTCFKNVWKNAVPFTDTLTLPRLHLLQTFQPESLSPESLFEGSLNVQDMLW